MADHTWCRHVFGEQPVWTRDIDRHASEQMLKAAAAATLESVDALRQSTLRSAEGVLFPRLTGNGHLPWVLPLGIYHRLRRHHGQQVCLVCLAEEPWLRQTWRFAWSTCCVHHRTLLNDACPICDSPYAFHRMALSLTGLACCGCGTPIRAMRPVPASQRRVRWQRKLERTWLGATIAVGNYKCIPPLDFFVGLRALASGVYENKKWVGLRDALPCAMRRKATPRPRFAIEHWRLPQRLYAMDVVRQILGEWPDRFIQPALKAGIYRCRFESRGKQLQPEWLEMALQAIERPWLFR